jgi:hypothetical protein
MIMDVKKRVIARDSNITGTDLYNVSKNPVWKYVYENSYDFEGFILNCDKVIKDGQGFNFSFFFNQIDYITDRSGDIIVDKVCKIESLQKDMQNIFDYLGIYNIEIPRVNISNHGDYRSYYSPHTKQKVEMLFRKDLDYFGYTY